MGKQLDEASDSDTPYCSFLGTTDPFVRDRNMKRGLAVGSLPSRRETNRVFEQVRPT
jgi:hypothetical protein